MMRYVVFAVIAVLTVVTLVWGWFMWRYYDFRFEPPEEPGQEKIFVVSPGQPFMAIARNLQQENLIKDTKQFLALAQEMGLTESVRAGEFLLHTGWLPDHILTEITSKPGIMHKFQVREGLTWWQTAELVEGAGLGSAEEFSQAIHNATILDKYEIPAEDAEGYLFPETYMLTRAMENNAQTTAEMMLAEFQANAHEVFGDELPSPEELHHLVILASIVEKETGAAHERRTIAGVYQNRLDKPMRLQADPTTIYGLGQEFNGNLRLKHLEDKRNKYNTYQHDGLPPGPICSPGLDALKAAADPEDHDYFFFVAKGDGTHHFSKTLREHNQAVARYQKWGRDRKNYRSTTE